MRLVPIVCLLTSAIGCVRPVEDRALATLSGLRGGATGRLETVVFELRASQGARIDGNSPVKLAVRGENASVPRTEFTRTDALESQGALRFEVPVRVQEHGPAAVHGRADFFACTGTRCVRQSLAATVGLSSP